MADTQLEGIFAFHHPRSAYPAYARCTAKGCPVRFKRGQDGPCSYECAQEVRDARAA